MKIKLIYLFMFLGLFAVVFSFNNSYVNATSPVQELILSVKTDKLIYGPEDKIEMEMTLTNTLAQEKTIQFSSGCQTSYIIGNYDHSQGLACTAAITSITLPPYGSHTWKMTHDLKNNTIPAGSYYVVGKLLGNNWPFAISQKMITIASMVNNPDCLEGHFYSSTTGLLCVRDSQVTGFLSEQGPSFTMWGTHHITNDEFAVCVTTPCPLAASSYLVSAGGSSSVLSDLKRYENSKVKIIGRLQWYNIEGGFWGIIATNIIPVNMNQETIRVISPNGGETIRIGQKYNIKWDSNRIPSNSDISISLKYYDITCGPAPMPGCQTRFYIDTVKNTGSYLWDTNKKMSGASTGPNSVSVVAGQKYVIELISSSGIKDVSDNYFTFVSSQIDIPVISTQGPVLKLGSKGQEVKVLQAFLGINADGIFGPITRQKVMEWQLMKNLAPDGAFGPASRLRANTN